MKVVNGGITIRDLSDMVGKSLSEKLKFFWINSTGVHAAGGKETSGIPFDPSVESTYGFNMLLNPSSLSLRYDGADVIKMGGSTTTPSIDFYTLTANNGSFQIKQKGLSITKDKVAFYSPLPDGTSRDPFESLAITYDGINFTAMKPETPTVYVPTNVGYIGADLWRMGSIYEANTRINSDAISFFNHNTCRGRIYYGNYSRDGSEEQQFIVDSETSSLSQRIHVNNDNYLSSNFECDFTITFIDKDTREEILVVNKDSSSETPFNITGEIPHEDPSIDTGTFSFTFHIILIEVEDPLRLSFDFEKNDSQVEAIIDLRFSFKYATPGPHYEFGSNVQAIGENAFVTGLETVAKADYQMVTGKYNEPDENALFVIGNGTSSERKNAFWIDENGFLNTMENFEIIVNQKTLMTFNSDNIILGDQDNFYLSLDYNTLQAIDLEQNNYFEISDLRDRDGFIEEEFIGDGQTTTFKTSNNIRTVKSVYVDNIPVEFSLLDIQDSLPYITIRYVVDLDEAPANGAIIKIIYASDSYSKIYTLGIRKKGAGIIKGEMSTCEGINNEGRGFLSHAEGKNNTAEGQSSHVEGERSAAIGNISHAEGYETEASGMLSHSEGGNTKALNFAAHAEGSGSQARELAAHAEGVASIANGRASHAEGGATFAGGDYAHTQNENTWAAGKAQTVIGTYNEPDYSATTTHPSRDVDYREFAFIIGNGTSSTPSNALTVDWNGSVWHKGDGVHIFASSEIQTTNSSTNIGQGILQGDQRVAKYGKVAQIEITFTCGATGAGENCIEGTISNTNYLPILGAMGSGYFRSHSLVLLVRSDGTFAIRNASSSTVTCTSNTTIRATYITA